LTRPLTANRDLQGELAALQAGKLNNAEFARRPGIASPAMTQLSSPQPEFMKN
jgi:hypothetical protein